MYSEYTECITIQVHLEITQLITGIILLTQYETFVKNILKNYPRNIKWNDSFFTFDNIGKKI